MVDSIVGAVIMVAATSALVLALQVAEGAMDEAGRYPLSGHESRVLESAGVRGADAKRRFWNTNLGDLPKELGGG